MKDNSLTQAVAVVILEPPAAPRTLLMLPSELIKTEGHIEERGRFPGAMKLAGLGAIPYSLVMLGDEKSSISLLKMIPVFIPRRSLPNLEII